VQECQENRSLSKYALVIDRAAEEDVYESSRMDAVFAWIELTALSLWVRESPTMWAFPFILVLHTIGMGFLAGPSAAIDLRILGVAKRIPLSSMAKFFPVMWAAFALNAASGLLLLIAYPAKALTNPIFYLKLLCIGLAVAILVFIRKSLFTHRSWDSSAPPRGAKRLAAASLLLWIVATVAGRLLAYTHTVMTIIYKQDF
jgi:hypothetical protein